MPKITTSRACDLCRKRKVKCDDLIPCANCEKAKVECTHNASVLKRGPRPRQQNQSPELEARLRTLNSLIASIADGGGSSALSSFELAQLDNIALPSFSPASFLSGRPNTTVQTENNLTVDEGVPDSSTVPAWHTDWGDFQFGGDLNDNRLENTGPGENAEGEHAQAHSGADISEPEPSPASAGSERHLLYLDSQGQTRFLGPSSGMPLLDKLKPSFSLDRRPYGGLSLAEEWISKSAPQDGDTIAPLPPRPSQQIITTSSRPTDSSLWDKLLCIMSQELVDVLVRSYFTVSHLLWPILHGPTFMARYSSPISRGSPVFTALVMAVCCLSSRYTEDFRLAILDSKGNTATANLLQLTRETISQLASEQTDFDLVQALFCMSVVQEGTSRPSLLWVYLSHALSMAFDLGLHRQVDDYSTFTAVDIEVRNRTMWAIYANATTASCTYGRPAMIRLLDLTCDEPAAVDDGYISTSQGVGTQPPDQPCILAGFVIAVRLHMILEKVTHRINQHKLKPNASRFLLRVLPSQDTGNDDLSLLTRVTESIPGDWTFTPATVSDQNSVRFFQKARVFTLRLFAQLLEARHRLSQRLEDMRGESPNTQGVLEAQDLVVIQEISQYSLGIIGAYCAIDARGRLGYFGAHTIAQLTQAGAGLISVILYLGTRSGQVNDDIWHSAMQGLPAGIQVLRKLGLRRQAGLRSAELLTEFSRVCRIPVLPDPDQSLRSKSEIDAEIPMLHTLPRRAPSRIPFYGMEAEIDTWLNMGWMEGISSQTEL